MYVVVHTASGYYSGTIAWQQNPDSDISSHFIVAKDGRITQMLDTDTKPSTQIEGNPFSISIENEGFGETLTAAQIEANAKILARAHQVHGIPLQLTGQVGVRGLGHHSMGAESGANWGHSQCPGATIKSQKPAILARAKQLVAGVPVNQPTEEDDMNTIQLGPAETSISLVGLKTGAKLMICNDAFGGLDPSGSPGVYALIVKYAQATGYPNAYGDFPGTSPGGGLALRTFEPWSHDLPAGAACLSIQRAGWDGSKVVPVDATHPAYLGSLSVAVG